MLDTVCRREREALRRDARYRLPTLPGYSAQMRPDTLARFSFPDGQE